MALSALPLFHRVAGQRVVVLGEGPAADARRRLVERAGGICCGEPEAHSALFAFVAIDEPRGAEAAAIRLRCRGLLVNVTDRPELCDFTVPSLLEREPVIVAVGTVGASAGLAKHLRLRLEALLPSTLGALAARLQSARGRLRELWPDPAERRRSLDAALGAGGVLDPLDPQAAERVDPWLGNAPPVAESRTIDIVLASDDPDDLTIAQVRWLGTADVVVHDEGIPEAILIRARADAERHLSGHVPDDRHGIVVRIRRGD